MKKLLIGFLILITACQSANPTPPVESIPTTAPQTPTETATATVTFTPAPTVTATPVPMYFTEEFNTDMSAWVSFQTGGETVPTVTLANDTLQVGISSPDTWYYAIHNSHEYNNVSVTAKFAGTPSGSMGLICRYGANGWYEFNLASDGTYSILLGQLLGEEIAQYIPLANNSSTYLQPGNLNYEIGLTCQDSTLLLYINNTLVRNYDVSKYGLVEGKIGITASSFDETPMTATFDWVRVGE